jgi:anthranilate phosphoribosyltransferase
VKPSFQPPLEEHPFAAYVRILGKGKTGSRSLTAEEAETAFTMLLSGQVDPVQLGAFLMLLRVKEESPEEIAGFVRACRNYWQNAVVPCAVDLDWSSYAGKKSQQSWYLLSALLLAENGIRVLMHGADGHTAGRVYSEQLLTELGIAPAHNLGDAAQQLAQCNFAWLPLRNFCLPLHDIMQLRHLLGLRSPVNTLARLLNPLSAPYSIQSVFHPAYAELHRCAEELLGQRHMLVFKGEGGEVEIKPHATTRCLRIHGGIHEAFFWPRSLAEKPAESPTLSAASLRNLWRGAETDNYGTLAVIHTCASALLLMDKARNSGDALQLANSWWRKRKRDRFH